MHVPLHRNAQSSIKHTPIQTPEPSLDIFLIDVEVFLPQNLRMRVKFYYSYDSNTLYITWEKICMQW